MRRITLYQLGILGLGQLSKQVYRSDRRGRSGVRVCPSGLRQHSDQKERQCQGFNGKGFEKIVGAERHVWMKDLGNQAVADNTDRMKIANPKAATDLLDLAIKAAKDRIGPAYLHV